MQIENFNIADPYDYDKIKVTVEEEKTPNQLAREILEEEMKLKINKEPKYQEFGISDQNGLFVSAGILDGPEIPSEPSFDKDLMLKAQKEGLDSVRTEIIQKFQEIQGNRRETVSKFTEADILENIELRVQQRMLDQEDRIEQQKIQKELQDEIYGKPQVKEGKNTDG